MRRIAKERRQLEEEQGESKGEGWFTVHPTTEKLKWKISLAGPAKYSVNPTGEETERPSPYAGGKFPLVVEFKASYPMTPPKVHFDVPVYHPQVSLKGDTMGHMCTDFVSKTWDPSKSVRSVLEKVLAMLAAPDPDGALEPEVGAKLTSDLEAFEKQAASYTAKYCTGSA